jgi:hypothetical protein
MDSLPLALLAEREAGNDTGGKDTSICVTPGEVSEASRGKGLQEAVGEMDSLPLALLAEREAGNDTK